jgi:hypothetical protein
MGNAYYFTDLKNWKINSPFVGRIDNIYSNYFVRIINQKGVQILVGVQTKLSNSLPIEKIIQCEVRVGQIVNRKTNLFSIYLEREIVSVVIYIPSQTEKIRKIKFIENSDIEFARIFYTNPLYQQK